MALKARLTRGWSLRIYFGDDFIEEVKLELVLPGVALAREKRLEIVG